MSVYKPGKSPYYAYDFELNGVRFFGTTKRKSKREAEQFEKERRVEAQLAGTDAHRSANSPMTVNVGFDRFWVEKAKYFKTSDDFFAALEWLMAHLGKNTLLREIGPLKISNLVAARKAEPAKTRKGESPIKNSTVNRTVLEPLRQVLNRARKNWEQKVQEINWADFLLPEPKERVRELTADEEERIFRNLRADYHPVVLFSIVSGFRKRECVNLRWSDIDWGNLTISVVGKGDKADVQPISPDIRDFLWELRGQHPEFVFTFVAEQTRPQQKRVAGQRYPITYSGLSTEWRRAKLDAKLIDYRFHDNRHTAATRFLRATGNLKLCQMFLRHEDIATTMKYAHASTDDLRKALDIVAESRKKPRKRPPKTKRAK
jgi:integrase